MLIHAARRLATDTNSEAIEWTVEAPDYDETVLANIKTEVPEGWVLLYVRPER